MAYILRKIGNADNVAVNYYEVDTERDMQEVDISNAPMGSRCYVVNTGSTYALNSNKEWKLVPTSGGETPSGGTDVSLGLTSATVGQTVKVKAVDTQGKPTKWATDSIAIDSTLTISGQSADAKAVGDAINRVNSAIEAKQDRLTEQDKQEIVLTGMTTAVLGDKERQVIHDKLTIIKPLLEGIAVAGAQYYLGECKTVAIVLPDDAGPGDMITVIWYNGDTPATLSITGKMLDFNFVPSANTRSEINALYDGLYWAVLGNEMAVPSEVTE